MITLRDFLEGKATLGFGSYGTANKAEKGVKDELESKRPSNGKEKDSGWKSSKNGINR